MLLEINTEHPEPRKVRRAVEALLAGEVIGYPTDTVYGLGCDISSKKAIDRLYQIKPMDRAHPLAFICPDLSEIARYAVGRQPDLPRPPALSSRALLLHPRGDEGGPAHPADEAQDHRHPRPEPRGHHGRGSRARPPRHLDHGAAARQRPARRRARDRRRLQGPRPRDRLWRGWARSHDRRRSHGVSAGDHPRGRRARRRLRRGGSALPSLDSRSR